MVSFGKIIKDRTNPRERKFASGESPYQGSLGQNKDFDDPLRNQWKAMFEDSPIARDFYANAYTFPGETAAASQAKLDSSANDPFPRFTNPGDNAFAQNFLNYYLDKGDGNSAEGRGLIEGAKIVRHENLKQLATTFATSGNAKSDPNVVGEFPRDDVAV
tara:strand:- start:3809 stop:4288 length:480 start_codon:yes stop_codon:yes gene_type:complete